MKHSNITITGKVQGVWYRKSAEMKAVDLKLNGFVKNEPDGSVYAEVEGREQDVDLFVEWCKEGPPLAEVKEVKVEEGEMQNFDSFEIRR